MNRFQVVLAAAAVAVATPVSSVAAEYPSRPVRIVVPWVAGGGTDILARVIAPRLAAGLGQQIVIDNRPGANGIVGAEVAAKATPDGHTLVLHAVEHVINGSTYAKLPYDTLRDISPVGLVASHSLVLVVLASSPAKSVKDLIAIAKAKPGGLNYGSWGEGSLAHLSTELLKRSAGVELNHVPYKGVPQAMNDILGGRLPFMFATMPIGLQTIKPGQTRALAVTSRAREPLLPDVPTMIESGYPGFDVLSWRALYAPAGTPKSVIDRLNHELMKVLQMQDVRASIANAGFAAMTSTPQELDQFGRAEFAKWAKVAKAAGVRIE